METGKRMLISLAKKIANDLGYDQIIIHGYDSNTNIQSICTYGKTKADCRNAAKGGEVIKQLLGLKDENEIKKAIKK